MKRGLEWFSGANTALGVIDLILGSEFGPVFWVLAFLHFALAIGLLYFAWDGTDVD